MKNLRVTPGWSAALVFEDFETARELQRAMRPLRVDPQ